LSDGFTLGVISDSRADVYIASTAPPPESLLQRLDRSGVRVVGDLLGHEEDEKRMRRIMRGCVAVLAIPPAPEAAMRIARELRLAVYPDLPEEIPSTVDGSPEYAFFIGRLERDFAQAREAIRVAVESEAGIPFLWADDGRHWTNVPGVRERTRLMIKHATFLVADLTLGPESPERENPSRAHEIGMAIAYDRPLVLTSQEPRRYPYFSIGDLQMSFWETEDELERHVRTWIQVVRPMVARHVYNPRPLVFEFDRERRFVGPNMAPFSE